MKNILLVDYSNLIARTFYSFNTRTSKGIMSGMVYGTLKILYTKIMKYNIDDVYICYDTKPYWKKTIFENYKSNRKGLKDSLDSVEFAEYIEQSNDLKKILPYFGFKCISYPNFESDDLIAAFCWKLKSNKDNNIFIYSSDHDFYQLIDDNVQVLKSKNNKDILVNKNNFFEITEIPTTELFKYVLAFAGDKGDNVPSIFAKPIKQENDIIIWKDPPNIISFNKISKIVTSPYNSIENLLNGKINYVKGIGKKTEDLFINITQEQKEAFQRNLKLVDLQDGGHKFEILENNKSLINIKTKENTDEKLVNYIFEKYECTTFSIAKSFPFYYINNVTINKPKINQNKFFEIMQKNKNKHFS